ncbi:MAG: T9SS type A sorting domain-containing protein [Parafilimonas sp.]|nr:T9SS type A sorting domain-containing protein [Parafilimonas sp.]
MKIILPFAILIFLVNISKAQSYNQAWSTCDTAFPQNHMIAGNCTYDSSNNIITGADKFPGITDTINSIAINKYSPGGNNIWQKTLQVRRSNAYTYLATDKAENIYVCTNSHDSNILIKLNGASSAIVWKRSFKGPFSTSVNLPVKLLVDDNGNAIVAGSTNFTNKENAIYLLKYDADGNEIWLKYIRRIPSPDLKGQTFGCIVNDAVLDEAGNIYVAGTSFNKYAVKAQDVLVARYNANGDSAWLKTFTLGVKQSRENGSIIKYYKTQHALYIGGQQDYAGGQQVPDSSFIFKLKTNGAEVWQYTNPLHYLVQMNIDNNGNAIYSGRCRTCLNNDLLASKISAAGTLLWTKEISDTKDLTGDPQAITIDEFNNIFLTKYYIASAGGEIFKYSPQGNLLTRIEFDTTSIFNNFYWAQNPLLINQQQDLFTFYSNSFKLNSTYYYYKCLRKYTLSNNIDKTSLQVPALTEIENFYVSPNPATSQAVVTFKLNKTEKVQLQLLDKEGRNVLQLPAMTLKQGVQKSSFNISNLISGIYIIKLITTNETHTLKLIKQ